MPLVDIILSFLSVTACRKIIEEKGLLVLRYSDESALSSIECRELMTEALFQELPSVIRKKGD